MKIFILLAIIISIVIIANVLSKKRKNRDRETLMEELKNNPLGYQYYLKGHPDLTYDKVYSFEIEDDKLCFVTFDGKIDGEIPLNSISRLNIQDYSTSDSKRSFSSVFLLGIWSFIFLNDNKNEVFRLNIDWNDNGRNNQTIFEYIGEYSEDRANTVYNTLQKVLSERKTIPN